MNAVQYKDFFSNALHNSQLESHALEKKQLVNEIVALKKERNTFERQSSRREIQVKQVQNEATRGLDALHESEERIQTLTNQVWREFLITICVQLLASRGFQT